jgi:hypothetical protein
MTDTSPLKFGWGRAILATTTSPVRQHAVEWRLPVKRKQWEKHLDEAAGPAARRAPYRTAIMCWLSSPSRLKKLLIPDAER